MGHDDRPPRVLRPAREARDRQHGEDVRRLLRLRFGGADDFIGAAAAADAAAALAPLARRASRRSNAPPELTENAETRVSREAQETVRPPTDVFTGGVFFFFRRAAAPATAEPTISAAALGTKPRNPRRKRAVVEVSPSPPGAKTTSRRADAARLDRETRSWCSTTMRTPRAGPRPRPRARRGTRATRSAGCGRGGAARRRAAPQPRSSGPRATGRSRAEYRDIEDVEREELDAELRFDQLGGDDDNLEGFVVAEPEAPDAGAARRRARSAPPPAAAWWNPTPRITKSPRSRRPGSGSDSGSSGWVHCECGACEDDGAHMVRARTRGAARGNTWRAWTATEATARAFFCATARVRGGRRAPAPPERRSAGGDEGGEDDEDDAYEARTARALEASFLADDEETLRDATRALEEDARGRAGRVSAAARGVPSRRALLNRACAARAWKCLRRARRSRGFPPIPRRADGLDKKSAHFFSCASRRLSEVALHVSRRRGDANTGGDDPLGHGRRVRAPAAVQLDAAWPLSPLGDGGTLMHSAAENDAPDAPCRVAGARGGGRGAARGASRTPPGDATAAAARRVRGTSGEILFRSTPGADASAASSPRTIGTMGGSPPPVVAAIENRRPNEASVVSLAERRRRERRRRRRDNAVGARRRRAAGGRASPLARGRRTSVRRSTSPGNRVAAVGGVGARLFASGASQSSKARRANATPALAARSPAPPVVCAARRDVRGEDAAPRSPKPAQLEGHAPARARARRWNPRDGRAMGRASRHLRRSSGTWRRARPSGDLIASRARGTIAAGSRSVDFAVSAGCGEDRGRGDGGPDPRGHLQGA